MATDRLTYSSQLAIKTIHLPTRRECLATRDMYQLLAPRRSGSERSERNLWYDWAADGLLIRRPRACRESIDSRDQLTRPCLR